MIKGVEKFWPNTLRPALRKMGIDIHRYPQLDWTEHAFAKLLPASAFGRLQGLTDEEAFILYCAHNSDKSNSQLLQDLFVCWKLEDKTNGFFVEFGATNGFDLSNTYQLEKRLSWRGILAEPAKLWHRELFQNRECEIDTRCVWHTTGEMLDFNEVSAPDLSTIHVFSESDNHSILRKSGSIYQVESISLNDLLEERNAPATIDYLSIDTEGSECSILQNFDFRKYQFNIITVEHNFTSERSRIADLLSRHDYKRVFPQFSRWDDWYIHANLSQQAAR